MRQNFPSRENPRNSNLGKVQLFMPTQCFPGSLANAWFCTLRPCPFWRKSLLSCWAVCPSKHYCHDRFQGISRLGTCYWTWKYMDFWKNSIFDTKYVAIDKTHMRGKVLHNFMGTSSPMLCLTKSLNLFVSGYFINSNFNAWPLRASWQDRNERKIGAQLYGSRVSNFLSHRIIKSLTFKIYGKLKFQCRNGPQNPHSVQGLSRTPLSISHH